ncbi:MAG: NAD(P)-binding protein [Desulfobacterales bacterium]|jgi:2-oxoacid:acceptor oxidoreductase delta subunit (pyruvate/2-ketoisovalerate family)
MTAKRRSDLAKTYDFKTWRDITPMNISMGTMLHNRTGTWRFIKPIYEDKIPACQNACPAGNDIEGWIKLIQKGEFAKAYWHLKREEPFPAILGRVCFKFCEDACNRESLDQCVSIKDLERYVGEFMVPSTPHPELARLNGTQLAVVGSGPAGMSAAYFARLLGFRVTIYEKLSVLGGILRVGIPSYRLPREVVAAEFEGLAGMGIELRPGTEIGNDIPLTELRNQYDYIFLASGVHISMKLGIPEEDKSRRIMSGLSLLGRVALDDKIDLGKRVVVIGGGNTAIDSARTALRLGCETTVIYRRSESEMPAHPEEIREAREEGVRFQFLSAPEKIRLDADGAIKKLVCCRMELGPADESGRRRPIKREKDLFDIESDSIISAIGEKPSFDYLKEILQTKDDCIVVDQSLLAHVKNGRGAKILAGGDIIDIAHTVVHAVASGKQAAIAMDCHRKGWDIEKTFEKIRIGDGPAISFAVYKGWKPVNPVSQNHGRVLRNDDMIHDYFNKKQREHPVVQGANVRKGSFDTYKSAYDAAAANREAARCMHCGRCTECDNCLIFCPDMSVLVKSKEQFGYHIDYDYCKGCGICFTECPRQAISMIEEEISLKG